MTGLFHRLGARALGRLPVLQPRRPGLFEPEGMAPEGLPPDIEAMAAGDVWQDASTQGKSVSETPPIAADAAPDAIAAAAPARRAAQAERAGPPLPTLADTPPLSPQPSASIRMAEVPVAQRTGPALPRVAPPPAARVHMAAMHPTRMVAATRVALTQAAGDAAVSPVAAEHGGGAHPAVATQWVTPPAGKHDPPPPAADRAPVAPGVKHSSVSAFGTPQPDDVAAVRPADGARPGIGSASVAAKAAGSAPAVEVTIGRVEIRFAPPAAAAPATSRPVGPPPLDVLLGRGGAR